MLFAIRNTAFWMITALGFLMPASMVQCKSVGEKTNSEKTNDQNTESETDNGVARKIAVFQGDTQRVSMIIDINAKIEVLGEGFSWAEGPVWVEPQHMLLFSDVPANKIFSWNEGGAIKEYLFPSGYTGTEPRGGEPGANGLALTPDGQLLLCQHGDRRIARMEAPLNDPKPVFTTVADMWDTKRFNSPNDLVVNSKGQIFFTDPIYGLANGADDPSREIDFQGVYRRDPDGRVILIVNDLTMPNGLALSPDEHTLYVSNSDPNNAIWMKYALDDHGNAVVHKLFYDATDMVPHLKGLPDGLKVSRYGDVFATGPGGVWIFDSHGRPHGRIETGEATANCAFNADQTWLYMTADHYLMRVPLKARPGN